jgi:hypothetical protein
MNRSIAFVAITFLLLIGACTLSRPSESSPATNVGPESQTTIEGVLVAGGGSGGDQVCPYPVEGFDETSLIGTWRAGFGDSTDTLVFREDGFYRQTTHVESLGFQMESDWQRWWVTYGPSGTPHLHLEGMRLCVPYDLADCESKGGGETSWWDFCEGQMVRMLDGGMLLAMGVPHGFVAPPRGFSLVPLTRDPDTGGFSYQFEN